MRAQPVRVDHAEAELVAAADADRARPAAAGRPAHQARPALAHLLAGARATPGLPTTHRLAAARRASTAGPIEWPVPKRLPVGPLMNFGYEGELLLPVQVDVPAGLARPGQRAAEGARRLADLQGRLHSGRRRPRS
ncbi:MAG: protein-disulfide reductase DsbD N-terminal domain-containing protein [Comamonadaceae bacterium]|nr:protein-disulfide reductase DsbD N-terminal domain-containing protein [Comamonadaceae bacterium]